LPNEDSQSIEFDTTALFRPAIADGRDRIDDGQRVDYGLEAAIDLPNVRLTGLVGQSYRANSSRNFGSGTGLSGNWSDLVFGYGIEAGSWLDGFQRLRWDFNDGAISAAESGVRADWEPVEASFSHIYQQERFFDGQRLSEAHQVAGSLRFQLTDHWAVLGRHRHDLDSGDALRSQIGISYADECISLELVGTRDRTRTAEVGPNDSIIFRIALRHLGVASGKQTLDEQ
jgi:LPS-assembly protein